MVIELVNIKGQHKHCVAPSLPGSGKIMEKEEES